MFLICCSENLKVIGITASNTWGLFLLVLLYGYGLVDIPRTVWWSSHIQYTLNQTYFRVAKLSMECSETQEKYEDTLEVCHLQCPVLLCVLIDQVASYM